MSPRHRKGEEKETVCGVQKSFTVLYKATVCPLRLPRPTWCAAKAHPKLLFSYSYDVVPGKGNALMHTLGHILCSVPFEINMKQKNGMENVSDYSLYIKPLNNASKIHSDKWEGCTLTAWPQTSWGC